MELSYRTENIASSTPSISIAAAIATAEDALGGHYNGHPASLQYLAQQDGSVALTHAVQIRNEGAGTWYDAFVDAHSGELVHITDFVAKASVGGSCKSTCPWWLIALSTVSRPSDLQAGPYAGFRGAHGPVRPGRVAKRVALHWIDQL